MKLSILKARVKRNNLIDLAGEFYRDESSRIVADLKQKKKNALLGIQKDDGIYTILGIDSIYYKTLLGKKGVVSFDEFLFTLKKITLEKGKSFNYEFIELNNGDFIWVLNSRCMTALWNTILYLSPQNFD